MEQKITIYCDGGCRGNQKQNNIGGYGAVIINNESGKRKEIHSGATNTTNNKMEMLACIKSLESIRLALRYRWDIELYSDSAYLVNGMNSWINGWIKKGWKNSKKKPVENKELWQQILKLKNQFNSVSFKKVKGHVGIELNERADELANIAMDELENKKPVIIDKHIKLKTILLNLKSNQKELEELDIKGFVEDAIQNLDLAIENINNELN